MSGRSRFYVRPQRLAQLLAPSGYRLAYSRSSTKEVWYVRPSSVSGCFERIFFQGSVDGQKVGADVEVSIVPLSSDHCRITQSEPLLMGTAGDKQIWPVRVGTVEQAIAWEQRMAELAPRANRELADAVASDLLLTTKRGRAAATFYLSLLPKEIPDLETHWAQLRARATPEQRIQMANGTTFFLPSQREEEWNRVRWAHEIAGYTVVLNEERGMANGFFSADLDVINDLDWVACLQLMASRIYGTP